MEFTAKTVEEATEAGLKELGLTIEQVDVIIKEEPSKGLFGVKKGKAVVEITKKQTQIEKTVEFIQKVLDILDVTAKASLESEGEEPTISIVAEKSSEIIGHRGEVLDALQTLAGAYANIGNKTYKKVVVDCENYRNKRKETLIELAHKLEKKATEMKRDVILEAMNPYDRRIIHTALSESETVTTKSEGKEPNRYVIIVPNDRDEFSTPYDASRSNDNFKKGGKKDFKNHHSNGKRPNNGGFRKGGMGFIEKKKTSGFSFGAYLGNSLKDNK